LDLGFRSWDFTGVPVPRPPVANLIRASLRGMAVPAYPPEARDVVRMDANTSLFGPNPAARTAAAIDPAQYPSGNSDLLRDALAKRWGVRRENVIVGNGSDEIFDLVIKAFVDPGDRVAFPVPSFVMYPFYARVNLGKSIQVPLLRQGFPPSPVPRPPSPVPTLREGRGARDEGRGTGESLAPFSPRPSSLVPRPLRRGGAGRGARDGGLPQPEGRFELDIDSLLAAKAKVTIIASPNSPTGNAFPAADLERLVRGAAGIVVIDEAYAEFCGQEWIRRTGRFGHLLVTRTFSKAHGLAGLRVGYAVGPAPLVEALLAVKPPFNVGSAGEAAALASLASPRYVERAVAAIRAERPRVAAALAAMGARPFPSDANFLLVDTGRPSRAVTDALARAGHLARSMADFPGLETCIRVTLGPRAVNDGFLRAMARVMGASRGRKTSKSQIPNPKSQ
jgi:histidinol-phosphate/aromatic aminotransferase/cobyric acid decarboxylase-like protein